VGYWAHDPRPPVPRVTQTVRWPDMKALARLTELSKLAVEKDPDGPNYFQGFEAQIRSSPGLVHVYEQLEADLQALDADSWDALKNKCISCVSAMHPKRGWQQLFDILNEAKGYHLLRGLGYSNVSFLPHGDDLSPDLLGVRGSETALVEVKTFHKSDDAIGRQKTFGRDSLTFEQMPALYDDRFKNKLRAVLDKARSQLLAGDRDGRCRKIAYILIEPDPPLIPERCDQIQRVLAEIRPDDVDLVAEVRGVRVSI
jgi:hypothetical protein